MKKIIYLLLTLFFVLSLVACGNKTEVVSGSKTTNETSVNNETSTVVEPGFVNDVDFRNAASCYYSENSTELSNCVIGIFPVNETVSVFQFSYMDYSEDSEIGTEQTFALTMNYKDSATYECSEEDQNGDTMQVTAILDIDGNLTVESNQDYMNMITGKFLPAEGGCDLASFTIIEFLRNIPEANIGTFGKYNPYDDVEDYIADEWFHMVTLYTEDEFVDRFLVADDLSAVLHMTDNDETLIFGSMYNTLEKTTIRYEINDDGEYEEYTEPLVVPYVSGGSDILLNGSAFVLVGAPWDLTKSIVLTSSDTAIVSVDGNELIGNALGTATITAKIDYCGTEKEYTFDVSVAEALDGEAVAFEDISADERYSFWQDSYSERATLDIFQDGDFYSVDIMWADDGYTTHHWSYIGNAKEGSDNVIELNGIYTIETIDDDENFSEIVVFENKEATLTLGSDGCYYWYDSYEDAGANCVFEKVD